MKWLGRRMMTLPLYLGLCQNERKFRTELKRLGVKEEVPFISPGGNATTHFFECRDRTSAIVCIPADHKASLIQAHAMLCHEAVHVWQEARAIIGEHKPSAEFEAYSIQAIAQELMVAYRHPAKKR